jgi:hypothetical protein
MKYSLNKFLQPSIRMFDRYDSNVSNDIALENIAAKGKNGGRTIPIHPELKKALIALHVERCDLARPGLPVVFSERGKGQSAAAITLWFHRLYKGLGLVGCSAIQEDGPSSH